MQNRLFTLTIGSPSPYPISISGTIILPVSQVKGLASSLGSGFKNRSLMYCIITGLTYTYILLRCYWDLRHPGAHCFTRGFPWEIPSRFPFPVYQSILGTAVGKSFLKCRFHHAPAATSQSSLLFCSPCFLSLSHLSPALHLHQFPAHSSWITPGIVPSPSLSSYCFLFECPPISSLYLSLPLV